MTDAASHIASAERLGEPRTNSGLFDLLAGAGWLSGDEAELCRAMVGFRNVVVHGYTQVDVAVLRDVLENHLGDLEGVVATLRGRLSG